MAIDRDKARASLPAIVDEDARIREASRIEAQYHLESAVTNLYIAKTGRIPEKEVLTRLVSAFQT